MVIASRSRPQSRDLLPVVGLIIGIVGAVFLSTGLFVVPQPPAEDPRSPSMTLPAERAAHPRANAVACACCRSRDTRRGMTRHTCRQALDTRTVDPLLQRTREVQWDDAVASADRRTYLLATAAAVRKRIWRDPPEDWPTSPLAEDRISNALFPEQAPSLE